MSLAEKLRQERLNKIEKHAIEFVEMIKSEIIHSAKKGYAGYSISLENRNDTHIIQDEKFLKKLEELLDGCTVKIETDEYTNIISKNKYYKYKLVISWK